MKTPTLIAVLTLLSASSSLSPAQDLGRSVGSTPYDKYFGPIRATLSELHSNSPPIELVNDLVKTGRGFRYYMKDPYVPQTPAETESSKSGDCKAAFSGRFTRRRSTTNHSSPTSARITHTTSTLKMRSVTAHRCASMSVRLRSSAGA